MKAAQPYTDVLKAGGAVLAPERPDGSISLDEAAFRAIGQEVSEAAGHVVLVSSAAIAAGMIAKGVAIRPDKSPAMRELQRYSAIGWRYIHTKWAETIDDTETGGLLLTREELAHTKTRNETLRVVQSLLANGEVPLVNENDAVTHDEISFGSNDILSAILAARMQYSERFGQVRLFLMTDVNGVYENVEDPTTRIPVIKNPDDYRHLAFDSGSDYRIGGMASKFQAVDSCQAAGVDTWIYNPADGPRSLAVSGEIGTYFPAKPLV